MRYRLRTLLIAGAIGPPILAGVWFTGVWILSDWDRIWLVAGVAALLLVFAIYVAGSVALAAVLAWVADMIIDAVHGKEK